jgi:predicted transcriptional regulator
MKTIAIKIDDELHAQLMAIAQLEGVTATEIIRDGVIAHLQAKQADGSLATKAQAVLDEIEREADVKRKAIANMLGSTGASPAKGRTRKATGKSGNGDPAKS